MSAKKKVSKQDPTETDTDTVTVDLSLEGDDADESPPPKLTAAVAALVDQDLLKKAHDVRDQRHVIRTRLKKIETGKGKVKASVYQKVKADYTARLKETKAALLAVKKDLDEALATLRHREADATRQVLEHEETLEEAQFRKELGEYTAAEFKTIQKREDAALKKVREEQSSLHDAITTYETIFGEEDLKELEGTQAPMPAKAPPPPNVGQKEPRRVSRQGQVDTPAPQQDSIEAEEAVPEQGTLLLYENGQVTEQFPIADELTVGRSPSNQVVLKEAKVSRRHAVIRKSGNSYMIVDNNSSNGTYINGDPITEHVLKPGDKIQIGSYEMAFSLS